jgi:oligopeptide transport system substrate-binding protein
VTNGPYKIAQWVKGKKATLTKNSFYSGGNPDRPDVDVYFIADDSAALNLYEKGKLQFLRRLPAEHIPKYKTRPDFMQVPLNRFDYIGFDMRPSSPFADKKLRKAFAQAINFEEFKQIFFALGAPGCPSLLESVLTGGDHCQVFSPKPLSTKPTQILEFYFSQQGGDDLKRAAEFFQGQWQKNLGVTVALHALENKVYINKLRTDPPTLFRKGVGLDRPTCASALEKFTSHHPDNFVSFSHKGFDEMVAKLKSVSLSQTEKHRICGKAVDLLFKDEIVGVPLGKMHFTMLLNPQFKGMQINELNQMDLSALEVKGNL